MAKKKKNPEDYEIGYGKPPREGQFSKGKSGNPKGRPKGSKNLVTMFHEVTQELIHVTENGQPKSMTKLQAIMLQMTNKAVSGELPAAKEVLQWNRIFEEASERQESENPDVEKDEVIMKRVLARMKSADKQEIALSSDAEEKEDDDDDDCE